MEESGTEIITVESHELEKVVNESGLTQTKSEHYMEVFQPYIKSMGESGKKISMLNKENPTDDDMRIARTIRLSLKDNRVASEKKKKDLKEDILTEGRLIDNLFGIVNNTSKKLEKECEEVEKFVELQEKAKKEKLKNERIELLSVYEVDTSFYDLENMPDAAFQSLYDGIKKQHEDKIAAEKKAEEEKIAQEKAQREENERLKKENDLIKRTEDRAKKLASNGLMFDGDNYFYKDVNISTIELKTLSDDEFDKVFRECMARLHDILVEESEERKRQEEIEKENQRKIKEAEDKKREEEDQARKDREAKEAFEKADDSVKLKAVAEKIKNIEFPEVSSEDANEKIRAAKKLLTDAYQTLLRDAG